MAMKALLVAVIAAVATVTSTPWIASVQADPEVRSDRHPTMLAQTQPMPGMSQPMEHPTGSPPFYRERTFLVVTGIAIPAAGFVVYRVARSWRRRRRGPTSFVSEAVLVVDLVESTRLATHYGDGLAMQARNALGDRVRAIAEGRGLAFAESTGDGCLLTFPSVEAAAGTAIALLRELRDRPPDLSTGPSLAVRAGISYGEILLDARGARHGAAINKAFRLEGLPRESFAQVGGEGGLTELPDRNRILLDEEAARELEAVEVPRRFVGFASLKGFSGLHRVYEVRWETPG
jgi:class 3 adenylate cyclase